jgi:hypothetical protein
MRLTVRGARREAFILAWMDPNWPIGAIPHFDGKRQHGDR